MTLNQRNTATQTSPRPIDVQEWVNEAAALLEPHSVVWCDGSNSEAQELIDLMVNQGTLTKVNDDLRPGSYLARSEPTDVARVESRTFICSTDPLDAGPTNNWEDPVSMRSTLRE
ncbi:MAG: phosphoenolpyruvate carboxykinase, partial [Pontimonas sp.]